MICHSKPDYFSNHMPTNWQKPQFPNQSARLQNRQWRKQQK